MSEYLSDQEQADRVIKLVKKHGSNVLTAVLLALTAYYGYQYWINKKSSENAIAINQLTEVAQKKQQMSMLTLQNKPVPKGEVTTFLSSVDNIVKKNPKTLFAQQALLQKAQYYVGVNELDKALKALQAAQLEYTKDKGLTAQINVRIAKILIATKKPVEAVQLLKNINLASYAFTVNELLGDAYQAQNKTKEAKSAYLKAWELNDQLDEKQVLALKMEAVGLLPPEEKAKVEPNNTNSTTESNADVKS